VREQEFFLAITTKQKATQLGPFASILRLFALTCVVILNPSFSNIASSAPWVANSVQKKFTSKKNEFSIVLSGDSISTVVRVCVVSFASIID
jgi:hypothetical protein